VTLDRIETDVLVVGGGLAALRAALSARTAGADVVVAVKRRLGQSGSSANTTGGYAAASAEYDPDDDAWQHYADTIAGGGWVNERPLVRALADEAPARLRELMALGAQFRMHDGRFLLSPSGDHRHPRVLAPVHYRGTDMTFPLREAVLAAGVHPLENTLIVDLLMDDGRVAGALGVRRDRAGACLIRARAVVLAAGGAGRLFSVTSNPVDVTGGGYALAMRAGAPLRDMEFIQFYPWRLIRPFRNSRVPIQPSTFVSGARLYNSRGERFMEVYDPVKKETATRDVSARGIFDQIRSGLSVDGGVVLDVSGVPDEQFRLENTKVIERLEPRGINYREIPLVIAPEAHFFMGGVLIDDTGASPIPGLYAAGENAGGAHGGNRLNSNAVPETQVIGHRAGVAAARARGLPLAKFDERPAARWARRLAALESETTDASAAMDALLQRLRDRMWLGIGIVRTAEGLRGAQEDLAEIRTQTASLPQATVGDLVAAIELEDLCAVGDAVAACALARTESRAAHYREDHPAEDPAWLRTVVYEQGRVLTRPIDRNPDEERRFSVQPARAASAAEHVE
jgi:fumarate reductase (CoM/CoB) subunit A